MKITNNEWVVGEPAWGRWAYAGICLFVILMGFLPVYIGKGPLDIILCYELGLGIIIAFLLRAMYRASIYLSLFVEGIAICRPFARPQFLAWGEITQIRGSVWSPDLTISDQTGRKKFHWDAAKMNAQVLLDLLVWLRPDLFGSAQPITLTMSPLPAFFIALDLSMLVLFGWNRVFHGQTGIALLAMLLFSLLVLALVPLLFPISITVLADRLQLHYPWRTRLLLAREISDVQQVGGSKVLFFDFSSVQIDVERKTEVILMFYNLGSTLLYAFLNAWLLIARMPRLEAGETTGIIPATARRNPQEGLPYRLPFRNSI